MKGTMEPSGHQSLWLDTGFQAGLRERERERIYKIFETKTQEDMTDVT